MIMILIMMMMMALDVRKVVFSAVRRIERDLFRVRWCTTTAALFMSIKAPNLLFFTFIFFLNCLPERRA